MTNPCLQKTPKALVITCLIGGGLWLLASGGAHVLAEQKLRQSSAVVEGRVLGAASHTLSKGGQALELDVEYTPPGHPAITRTFDVDSAGYKAALASGRALVTYCPQAPEVSRVTHFSILPFQLLIGLGCLMLASGLVCLKA